MKIRTTNLQMLLGMKGIPTATVKDVIGCKSEKTAYNKIYAGHELTLSEALAIKNQLFPEYDFDYIFADYRKGKAFETDEAAG